MTIMLQGKTPAKFVEIFLKAVLGDTENHIGNDRLFRHAPNSSMLIPSQTLTRAAKGGFSAPKDENQIKSMQPIQRSMRIIWAMKLQGHTFRRNEKYPDPVIKASPIKKDQRKPNDANTNPANRKI
jgi:hypothetical protein